jgi:hypothetical protein
VGTVTIVHMSLHVSTRPLVNAGLPLKSCGCGCAKAFAIFAEAHLVPELFGDGTFAVTCGTELWGFKRGLPNALVPADADSGGPIASQD